MMSTIFLVVAALCAFAALWYIFTYNRFVRLKTMAQEAWSGIDVQLKRRYDLIPNLVATVKGYSEHEKGVLEKVTQMRAAAMGATTVEEHAQAESGLTSALKTLFAVAENYPDLKANQNFLELQVKLAAIEDEVQLARRYYNGTTRNYNMLVQTFPSNIVAFLSSFHRQPYFELASSEERETPKVTF